MILFIVSSTLSLFAAENSLFVRYADINSDGSKIVFSYQGDLWTMESSGGKATRFTIHEAYDGWPQWSPDDNSLGLSSNRFGNYDIFKIHADGGLPQRITFHSANDLLSDFSLDNKLLFKTAITLRHVE